MIDKISEGAESNFFLKFGNHYSMGLFKYYKLLLAIFDDQIHKLPSLA